MRSIMVLNAKGGSGKSTIATNLAAYYAYDGKTFLVDFDPQGSSIDWLKARPSNRPPIQGVKAWSGKTTVPRNADFVVYDTPARVHGRELTDLLRRAESVIVPVLPSPVDMRAATHFVKHELLENPRVQRRECRVALVANRCKENTLIYHELEEFLNQIRKVPVLSWLRETQNYNRASAKGLGLYEMAPYLVSRDLEQWEPIIKWLHSKRSVPTRK
jgi:chromosome partitioning protein